MSKKISIYDIAKYVGVSPATVSYAINGKKKISLETKQKIFKAIDELGYVPDPCRYRFGVKFPNRET